MKKISDQLRFVMKNFWIFTNILVLIGYLSVANLIRLKDPKPLIKDSEEYVILSHNMAFRGIFSFDGNSPTNFREPVTSFLNAVNIRLFTSIDESTYLDSMISKPEIITQLTQINIFYLMLFFLAMWWLTFLMTNSHAWVIFSTFLPMIFFSIGTTYTQRLLSDLPSIILLMIAVCLLLSLYRRPTLWNAIGLSFFLAVLILSKGVFYYLVPIYILFVGFLFWIREKDSFRVVRIKYLTFGIVGTLIFLSPWMIRNKIYFDDYSLTQRGGTILMIRAEKNQMNHEEFKGAFYVYSPDVLKKLIFERWFGYKESDFWDGGKLQRLNRDLINDVDAIKNGEVERTVSFLRRTMFVTIPQIQSEAIERGVDPDKFLKEKAIKLIKNDPIKHLKTSLVFAWRGIWFYQGNHLSFVLLIGISYLLFFLTFIRSLIVLDVELIIFLGISGLIFFFHLFLTHNIPRYCLPMLPFNSLCLVFIVRDFFFINQVVNERTNHE